MYTEDDKYLEVKFLLQHLW